MDYFHTLSYTEFKMFWFWKSTSLSQAIITLPVIGFINGHQSIIMFGVGLPLLFGTMQATGNISYGAAAFIIVILFAMIRPPVISYEGRLYAYLKGTVGLYGKKDPKKTKTKSKVFGKSSKMLGKATGQKIIASKPDVIEPMTVNVEPNSPVTIDIKLKTRTGLVIKQKVRILLDDTPVTTTISSSAGLVTAILDPDECAGSKTVAVCEVLPDGTTGPVLTKREIVFKVIQ